MPADVRALYPFESHYFEIGGGLMHFVDEGQGPPVVLLHGNPTWSFYFRDLIKGLRDRHRVIAPDHIGCGLSEKPQNYPYTLATHIDNVEKLLAHLGVSDLTLGVHDWGGPIGFGWAARHPEQVRRLIVFNTAAFLTGEMPFRIRLSGWPIVGEAAILGLNAFSRAAVRMAVCHPMAPAVRRGYLWPYEARGSRVAQLCFVRDIPYSPRVPSYRVMQEIEAALPRFRDVPMTIFWGMRDFCFTPAYLAEWSRRFPGAEVHRFEDAGHYVVEEAAAQILERLRG